MSYVELIVVLGIFSVVSAVSLYNYGDFQARVDIKNLASDFALKIVEAQKSSLSGLLPPPAQEALIPAQTESGQPFFWKPSYGIYLEPASNNQSFVYFVDLNNNNLYDSVDCTEECLNKITFTKNYAISDLRVFYQNNDPSPNSLHDLTVSFSRINSGATMRSSTEFSSAVSYVQITISSPDGIKAIIKLYPSGRVQMN